MKKIVLITCALKCEYDIVKQSFGGLETSTIKFKFLLTGVGNYQALLTLQEYLSKNAVDFVINIGVCGYIKKQKETFFQVYRIYNLASKRESLVPLYFIFGSQKSIASSEKIVTSKQELEDEIYVDMESYAIDFVCSRYKVPYAIFKLPFDRISPKSREVSVKDIVQTIKRFPYDECVHSLEIFLKSIVKPTDNLEKYKDDFSFTYAEFEIFKKLYFKWMALKKDFKKFFKENKNLKKTEFLKKMQQMN